MRQFIPLILISLLFLSLAAMFSCDSEGIELEPYQIDGEYLIIRPDEADKLEVSSAIKLTQSIEGITLTTDWVKRGEEVPASGREILVGTTNRPESIETAEALRVNDFVIKRIGQRIVILGGSNTATEKAVDYFIENCIDQASLLLPPEGSECRISTSEYPLDSMTLCGKNIKDYSLYINGNLSKLDSAAIDHFISEISQLCGWKISLTASPEASPLITVNAAALGDENSWQIDTSGESITISRSGEYSLPAALNRLYDLASPKNGEKSIDITLDSSISGKLESSSLVKFNLPEAYPAMEISSAADGGVWEAFEQAVSELPEEITVLESFYPEKYPESMRYQIFVSPNGDDSALGTIDAPLKNPQTALDRIAGAGGGIVWLREGEYNITSPLTMDKSHSGSSFAPTFISSYNGERVKLSGGVTISRESFSTPTDSSRLNKIAAKNILVCDISSLGITKDQFGAFSTSSRPTLIIDGRLQTIARYPNLGEKLLVMGEVIDVGKVTDQYSDLYEENKDKTSGWILKLSDDRPKQWTNAKNVWIYGSVFAEWHRQHYPVVFDLEAETMSSSVNCYLGAVWKADNTFYYYNILEELDAPGEWYLDYENGLLYIYPEAEFESVSLITSESKIMNIESTSNIVINGLEISGTLGNGISATGCEQIIVQNCSIYSCGKAGLTISSSKRSGAIYTEFRDNGDGQCDISSSNRKNLIPEHNFIQNCTFSSNFSKSGAGISGVATIVSHNYFDGQQIFFGTSNESIVEYNEFYRGPDTNDAGMIYLNGRYLSSRGNHIRYNYFHHLEDIHAGVYLDDCSGGHYVYGNIVDVVNTDKDKYTWKMTYRLHNGRECVFYNNISIGATSSAFSDNANYYNGWLSWPNIRHSAYEGGKEMVASEVFAERYPLYTEYYYKLAQNEEEALVEGYTRNALEDEVLEPAYNIYKGNLIINTETPFNISEVGLKTASGLDENFIADDSPLDSSYQVIDDAVYELLPNYKNVPFEKMGLSK